MVRIQEHSIKGLSHCCEDERLPSEVVMLVHLIKDSCARIDNGAPVSPSNNELDLSCGDAWGIGDNPGGSNDVPAMRKQGLPFLAIMGLFGYDLSSRSAWLTLIKCPDLNPEGLVIIRKISVEAEGFPSPPFMPLKLASNWFLRGIDMPCQRVVR